MNMSYCRFQNTLCDLRDCANNLDNVSSDDEKKARKQMIALMVEMLESVGYTVEHEDDSDVKAKS